MLESRDLLMGRVNIDQVITVITGQNANTNNCADIDELSANQTSDQQPINTL